MKKAISLTVMILISLCYLSSMALAYSFNISTEYSSGDQITFNINFLTDETVSLNAYGLSFVYNSDDLEYHSYNNAAPAGLFPDFPSGLTGKMGADIATTPGILENFNAGAFGSGIVLNTDTYLGSITFNVLEGAVADGTDDFDFYLDPSSNISFTANTTNVLTVDNGIETYLSTATFDIGTPAPVPVPSALWLLGTGLVGLAGIRRKTA